jgi:hypothetical protein
MLAFTADELYGRSMLVLVHPDDPSGRHGGCSPSSSSGRR